MIETLAIKEEPHQAEGLSLKELEGQTAELLPNRVEMRHRRRNLFINNSKTVTCGVNVNVAGASCNAF
jgi:hypothetical protein